MTSPVLDPRYRTHLRNALAAHIQSTTVPVRRHRWRRTATTAGALVAVALSGGGVAVAAGFAPWTLPDWIPGLSRNVVVSPSDSSVYTGTVAISTSNAPTGANGVAVTFACLDPGTISFPDGSSVTCDGLPMQHAPAPYVMGVPPGTNELTFTAPEGMRWGLTLAWVQRNDTPWGINARGETFGAVKENGQQPDLVAAVSKEGVEGYIRMSEFAAARALPATPNIEEQGSSAGTQPISIYASDGITVLATFDVPVGITVTQGGH